MSPAVELCGRAHQVQVNAMYWQPYDAIGVLGDIPEVRCEQQLRPTPCHHRVGAAKSVQPLWFEIQAEHGLVNLHPFDAHPRESLENARIRAGKRLDQAQAVESRLRRLR